jgi:Domain of unknown function (DUF6457)
MSLSTRDWLNRYAAAIGTDSPSGQEVDSVLGLAGIAAHASERTAAPVSCWLAARSGLTLAEAIEAAKALAGSLEGNDEPRG